MGDRAEGPQKPGRTDMANARQGDDESLAEVPVGHTVVVRGLSAAGGARRRLLDLGLVPGTVIRVVRRSPLGDPTAYLIRGSLLALRREDAARVLVCGHGGTGDGGDRSWT